MTSLIDPLTNLPARRRLEQRLDALYANYAPRLVGLVALDIDGFGQLNERLGQRAGDHALRLLGPRLRRALDGEHLVVRLWSDEFAVLVERDVTAARLASVAARVRSAFDEPVEIDGRRVQLSASVGAAIVDSDDGVWAELLRRADVAIRQAKRYGTGYELYRDESRVDGRELLQRVEELRDGIGRGELVLQFQPQLDVASDQVRAVEALVRWKHPSCGLLEPHEFLLIAEAADLMEPLTRMVLGRALEQLAAWRRDGRDLTVAVNLALPDLLGDELPIVVERLLAATGVPAERLTLELSEQAVAHAPGRVLATLERLHARGVVLSLDHVGVSPSSVPLLQRLPLDELKLDRSLVARVCEDLDDAAIVRSLGALGHDLGMRVVGVGVEDEETAEQLRFWGFDVLQGFAIGEPLSADELERFLDGEDADRDAEA